LIHPSTLKIPYTIYSEKAGFLSNPIYSTCKAKTLSDNRVRISYFGEN